MAHDHADLVPRADAVERVLAQRSRALDRLDTERVSIDALAGRVLAEPVAASEDQPPYSYATMDGYALDATEDYPLDVVDREVFPEDDPGSLDAGEAVRIATGAPVPEHANAVLKVEEASTEGGELTGTDLSSGTYVYERGSNVEAGEELFAAGERLSPKDAILLRDLGVEAVAVRERLSVGLLATGTEIHEGRIDDLDSPMLAGLVESWGHDATYEGTVPDDYDTVEERVADLAAEHDVVVTTGGTSVGKKDYAIRVLDELGDLDFHRVAVRPGKPIAMADLPEFDATALAVPGKPVGAHTITTLVARPFFTGRTDLPTVPAEFPVDLDLGPSGFEYAIPVTLDDETATPLGHVGSPLAVYEDTFDPSVLSSSTRTTRADGFVLTESGLDAGEQVRVVRYESVE
ncbi:molybdopterin molybdotransferase MoeA [Halobacterium jilantaiense]|uniref:Molybdopterin molybdotransferase n=1 Tax=Halobacterium jilantaiense TaxID=355548 RepID=A0A1I0QUL0_9EURY|nr:molybdopterin molybdotransferase MoeA [Halobacterium jilantaiense]SEW31307.1 molybdopterin molybdotransferase [Halobacterium jilantaiense]